MRLFELVAPQLITEVGRWSSPQPIAMDSDGISIEQITLVANYIQENCSKWLAETDSGRYTFFRGIKENTEKYLAFTLPVLTNREPRDSIRLGHDAYNAIIEAMGGTADRSNSVFAVSDYTTAKAYGAHPSGQASIIFPIGDYSYTWSKAWDDWNIDDIDTLESFVGRYMYNIPDLRADAEYAYEQLLDTLQQQAANAQTEIARGQLESEITGLETWQGKRDFIEEYIEDNNGSEAAHEAYTNPSSYNTKTLARTIMVDEDLCVAAEMKHELMIHCENVLYIDPGFYELVWAVLHGHEPVFTFRGKAPGEAP